MAQTQNYGTGKRKTSVARVFLRPGKGAATVNGRPLDEYFTTVNQRTLVREPLQVIENPEAFGPLHHRQGWWLEWSGRGGSSRHCQSAV